MNKTVKYKYYNTQLQFIQNFQITLPVPMSKNTSPTYKKMSRNVVNGLQQLESVPILKMTDFSFFNKYNAIVRYSVFEKTYRISIYRNSINIRILKE